MSGISGISDYSAYGNFASGKKINTAADGAAELGIIQEQTKQINGYDAGSRNIESGKDALNISDAALGNVTDYLQRMRELAIQAKSGLMSDSDKGAIQSEIDQLKQGIANIADQTDYNGKKLLDGSNSNISMVSSSKGEEVSFDAENATLDALGIKDFDVTRNFSLDTIDNALDKVTEQRSKAGAQYNRLDYASMYNANVSYNTTASKSRLEDLDFAEAISDQKKNETLRSYQLLMQRRQQEDEARKMNSFFI